MPLANFTLKSGVNKEVTEYTGQGQWIDSDNVRFFQGLPQKIKGWEKFLPTTLVGVVRAQHAWVALDGIKYNSFGTDRKLYIYQQGIIYDITPIRQTFTSQSNVFTTTENESLVTVTIAGHGAIVGAFVTFDNVTLSDPNTSFDAATFEDVEFEVQEIVDGNNFTINVGSDETQSGITGQGSTDAAFQINPGPAISVEGYGWGTGTWNTSRAVNLAPNNGWGTPEDDEFVTLDARRWSLDNFGEDLIATVLNGGTYIWDKSLGPDARATQISGAPTKSRFSLVSTPDRHLLNFGTESEIGNTNSQDDLLIRFSDQENISQFQPTSENTAGSLRIADGSRIVGSVRSRGAILVFTETALQALQYIGPPFTFGLRQLGQNCGLIGQDAAIDLNGIVYWMSQDAFYLFDGSVKKMPCTVQQYVFNDFSPTASQNVFVGHSGEFNEIFWFYASNGSDQLNRSVFYNYQEQTWWTGSLVRTSWLDREVFDEPLATQYNPNLVSNVNSSIQGLTEGASVIYQHETGNDAQDANGTTTAITSYLKSGAVSLDTGDNFAFIRRFIPDFQNQSGNVSVNFEFKRYPNDTTPTSSLNADVSPTTDKVDMRGRGRHFTANIVSNATGDNWRMGTIRFDLQPDGGR